MPDLAIFILNLNSGGAEKNAVVLANEFAKQGRKVDLVILDDSGVLIKRVIPQVNIVNLGTKQIRYSLKAITIYLCKNKPKTILVFMFPYTLLVTMMSKIFSPFTRIIVTERTTLNDDFFKGKLKRLKIVFVRWMMKLIYPMTCSVVLVSKTALEGLQNFLKNFNKKIHFQVIYNPCLIQESDTVFANAKELLPWFDGQHKKIMTAGRLVADKDFETLISAFNLLLKEENAKLIIVGEGPERIKLERLVNVLGIQKDVFFAGFQNNVNIFYENADLFVLSSVNEGMPNVLLEAINFGLTIVSTNCKSGPSEILDEGQYGYLVPIRNVDSLKDGMKKGLQKPFSKELLISRVMDFSLKKTILAYEKALFLESHF